MENITVNGQSLKGYLTEQSSKDAEEFYLFELKSVGHPSNKYKTRSEGLVRCSKHGYKKTTGCISCSGSATGGAVNGLIKLSAGASDRSLP